MAGFMDGVKNYQAMQGYGTPVIPSVGSNVFGLGDEGVINPATGVAASAASTANGITDGSSLWDSFFQSKNAQGMSSGGWGTAALGIGQGLASAWLGFQQYGLAKDTLKTNKEQFNKNYAAQKQTTNASLEDRQRARVASNPGAYQSVGTYMNQNGIA